MNNYQKSAIETKRQKRDLSQGALLIPKFHLPRVHSALLVRERLFSLLDRGLEPPFTLLSAPAGSGKTTLVSQWITARRLHQPFPAVAWVSLDASDNDPMRFWSYLITACQVFQIDVREAHDAFLEAVPQPPFVPSKLISVLTPLLNALTQCSLDGILVLDTHRFICGRKESGPQAGKTLLS